MPSTLKPFEERPGSTSCLVNVAFSMYLWKISKHPPETSLYAVTTNDSSSPTSTGLNRREIASNDIARPPALFIGVVVLSQMGKFCGVNVGAKMSLKGTAEGALVVVVVLTWENCWGGGALRAIACCRAITPPVVAPVTTAPIATATPICVPVATAPLVVAAAAAVHAAVADAPIEVPSEATAADTVAALATPPTQVVAA